MGYLPIDLRSDTVTRPTSAMLEAMLQAEVGDDIFSEDPSVNLFEEEVAAFFGKEMALFVPSGTMANQIAINVHCRPGESIICEKDSHIFLYEAGGAAANSGVQFDLIDWQDRLSTTAIELAHRVEDLHSATTSLLAVENTHNAGGGRSWSLSELHRISATARRLGLATHCDGARIWNAAISQKSSEKELAAPFDSIAVCFSKGLGAPVGSALCGNKSFISRARKIRKRWGGGMRQSGYLAAAALYAMRYHRTRLVEDHERTRLLLVALIEAFRDRLETTYEEPGSNIIYFRIREMSAAYVQSFFAKQGILLMPLAPDWVRAVFHLQIDDQDLDRTVNAVKKLAASS